MRYKLLVVLVAYVALAAAPMPPMPPVVKAKSTKVQSPRAKEQSMSLVKVNIVIQKPQVFTNTLAADFPATKLTNLIAFIEGSSNLTTWYKQSLPYPTNGGTMKVAFTNFGVIFMRAGYSY